jgi:hypothetical protein
LTQFRGALKNNVMHCVYNKASGFRLHEVHDKSHVDDLIVKGHITEAPTEGYFIIKDALKLCTGTAISIKAMVYECLE